MTKHDGLTDWTDYLTGKTRDGWQWSRTEKPSPEIKKALPCWLEEQHMIETSLAEKERILLGVGYQWRELSQYGESFIECKNPLLNWETVIVGEDWQLGDKERNEAISRMWTHYEAQL